MSIITDVKELTSYRREVHICFFALYCWEFLVSLWFEYRLCSRQLQFKWPLIFYFLTRYLALSGLLLSLMSVYTEKPVNCHAILQASYFLENAAVLFASCNFMIRAIIIWEYRRYILIPLVVIASGQCALLGVGYIIKGGSFDPELSICTQYSMNIEFIGALSIYNTVFGLIILVTSIVGLKRVTERSSFADSLRRQGIIYFVTVFGFHAVITVCVFVTHNTIYSVVPAFAVITISPALSCRMVRSTLKAPPSYYTDRGSSLLWCRSGTPTRTTEMEERGCQFSTHIDLESHGAMPTYAVKGGKLGLQEPQALPSLPNVESERKS